MIKKISFLFLLITSLFLTKPIILMAANGCGGNMWCAESKDYNTYDCKKEGDSCKKYNTGTDAGDCFATQDDCFGWVYTYSCRQDTCTPQAQMKKVGCCTAGGGSGSGGCPVGYEWSCVPICIKESSCPTNNQQGVCGIAPNGELKMWCGSCSCRPVVCAISPATLIEVDSGLLTWNPWNPGAIGITQKLYICTDSAFTNCPIANGIVLGSSIASYTLPILTDGTFYYVKIVTYKDAGCTAEATSKFLSSCNLSPTLSTVDVGQSQNLNLDLKATTELRNTTFSSSNSAVVSVSKVNDTTAVATGVSVGNGTTVWADVAIGAVSYCTSNLATVNVLSSAEPWWQVVDGDITTNGSIASKVPAESYLNAVGLGGFPGVTTYGGSL